MSAYPDERIARLAAGGESRRVERRRSAADERAVLRHICAFANDLPGYGEAGVLLLGVGDDGEGSGTPIDDALLDRIAAVSRDGDFLPAPSVTVERRRLGGREIAVVFVEPAPYPPVRYRGRAWVRVGPAVYPAAPDDEARLGRRGTARRLPFDCRPCESASVSDLDERVLREEYFPAAVSAQVADEARRPFETRLRTLRLLGVGSASPVWGALLCFARDPLEWLPGAYVQFRRIAGLEASDPVSFERRFAGRVTDVLRGLEESIGLAVRTRAQVAGVERELRFPDYPIGALTQLVRNAVLHRSYETNAPIRVCRYDDRVEIASPGGPFGRVGEDGFDEGITDCRNPLVAEVLSRLGFAQGFGAGIPLAKKALAANGNPPPEFSFSGAGVTAVVRAAP